MSSTRSWSNAVDPLINLPAILNMNVYMVNVGTKKLAFVHSVDIRGNTDESWTRGMTYLLKNYLLSGNDEGAMVKGWLPLKS